MITNLATARDRHWCLAGATAPDRPRPVPPLGLAKGPRLVPFRYSTVTVLARFRGLNVDQPRSRAMR